MKKILTLSAAALLCGAALSAKTADELRIYINPGHGSWGPNDRPMKILRQVDTVMTVINPNTKTINAASEGHTPDTTAFYESNTNLRKGLALLDRLESYGLKFDRTKNQSGAEAWQLGAAKDLSNNIVMSHVKAGPYPYVLAQKESYNRDLTEIAVEAEYNNFDMFISIHSNAASEGSTTNYLPFIYRGTDGVGGDRSPGSRDMALACWPYAFGVKYQLWTDRKTAEQSVVGDVSFYHGESASSAIPGCSGYLGVIKHNVPGFLVEGYFHTYQPSRQRAMNFDADRIEGYQYARGIADYFNLQKESTGEIYGLVRDIHVKFANDLYTPRNNTNDCFLPLNGVTVTLKKDGTTVATKVTDNHYNGVFMFDNLQPGTYTLELSHPNYKPADADQPTTVTVKAAETSYPEIFLENINYVDLGEIYKSYPDELAEEPAVGPADEYVFNQEYVDQPIEALAGKNIRRTIVRGDKAIILAHDDSNEPVIVLQDLTNKTVVRTIGTDGTVGSIAKIGDITMTAEGFLIGVNADVQKNGGDNMVKIYKWDNNEVDGLPEGNPTLLKEMNHAGGWNNAEFGKTITYLGTLQQGYLLIANKSTTNTRTRIELVEFIDGEFEAYSYMNFNSNKINDDDLGDYEYVVSPIHDDHFIITSELKLPMEVQVNKKSAGVPKIVANLPENLIDGTGFRSSFFKYSGKIYMVAPNHDDNGKNTGVTLLDVTNGLDKATVVNTTNTTIPVTTDNTLDGMVTAWAQSSKGTTATNAYVTVNRDSKGAYTSSAINLYVVRDDAKMTKFTTANAEQPKQRGNFAYDLNMTKNADNYAITFKSTGAANNAKLILTNIANAEDVVTVDLGAVSTGENTATFDASTLSDGNKYNWAIEIDSKAIPAAGKLFEAHESGVKTNTRGGVVVITDPEQQSYGKVVVAHGFAQGIEIYNPDLTLQGTYHANAATMNASNGASLFRGDQRDGKAYFTDWSDKGAGYWIIDPQNPETLTNFLEGTNDGTGAFAVDGTVIGGGATSVAFQGKGENCKMYSFVEDYPSGNAKSDNGGNTLQRYDIGTAATWGQAPNKTFSEISGARYFSNTNVELFATDNGLFVSQIRNADMNTTGAPAFVYIDNDGNILFNSGKDLEGVLTSGSAGIALTQDLKTFAIGDPASGGITIMSVEWDGNTPSMTKLYTIPATADNNELTQMRFDPAGNLHVLARGKGYQMFSLVNSEPKAVTPAAKALIIEAASSGVEDVVTDREVSLEVYPNPATDVVTVNAGEDITSLAIYSLTGSQMGVDTEVNGGVAVMNVSSLQNGAYIINVNGKSVKLIKR